MMTVKEIKKALEDNKSKSAWGRGVTLYAYELIEEYGDNNGGDTAEFWGSSADKKALLNGADNWSQYSWGGCSIIYDGDIAARLCSPSELKKRNGGEWKPNHNEEWLDVQARALSQASALISCMARRHSI
jgi:hypothetical protein